MNGTNQQGTLDSPVARRLLSIDDAATALGVGKTLVKELVTNEEIFSVKLRRRRLIPVEAIDDSSTAFVPIVSLGYEAD